MKTLAIHIRVNSVLNLTDLPAECIAGCSAQGACDDAVAHWLKELHFTVDRDRAIRCLQGYGAWDTLEQDTDAELAARVLWLACGDFAEFQVYCDEKGIDPRGRIPEGFDPPAGSDIFVLE